MSKLADYQIGDILCGSRSDSITALVIWRNLSGSNATFLLSDGRVRVVKADSDLGDYNVVGHLDKDLIRLMLRRIMDTKNTIKAPFENSAGQFRMGDVVRGDFGEYRYNFGVVTNVSKERNEISIIWDYGNATRETFPVKDPENWKMYGHMNDEILNALFDYLKTFQ